MIRPPCFLALGPINGLGNCSMAGAEQLILLGLTVECSGKIVVDITEGSLKKEILKLF